MEELIKIDEYPIKDVLDILLKDWTTGKNIIWATDSYLDQGEEYTDRFEIKKFAITGNKSILIQPRVFKATEAQQARTKAKAEVFTPSWIVNKMVNALDENWSGNTEVLNSETSKRWNSNQDSLSFKGKKDFEGYVNQRVLEITCGEAPFIVSRYDAATGQLIPINERIGVLDRKLRAINEKAKNEDWLKYTRKAFKSVYGYEYQGDNLLIARINLLLTFVDYYQEKFDQDPDQKLLKEFAKIIRKNFWQMDGLTNTVPLGMPQSLHQQLSLFSFEDDGKEAPICQVVQWGKPEISFPFELLNKENFLLISKGKEINMRKFDVIIGNPPYQDETNGLDRNYAPPVYNLFMDQANLIGRKVLLIHPARFLFNAGSTPKKWNEKMLHDPHFSVLDYNPDSSKIFPGLSTPIKGGIAITLYDRDSNHGPIEAFSPYPILNSIIKKVNSEFGFRSLSEITYSRTSFKLTPKLHQDHPDAIHKLSKGHAFDLSSNIFNRIPEVFNDEYSKGTIEVIGREDNKRVKKYINKEYLNRPENFESYKVYLSQAFGSGLFGEQISESIIGFPEVAATETFLSIGNFSTKEEAHNLSRYIKTKFARALLGVLKVTQNGNKPVWKMIPIQNFTSSSDIDWSKSIPNIDQQLYHKYALSPEEIKFIETHVKEME